MGRKLGPPPIGIYKVTCPYCEENNPQELGSTRDFRHFTWTTCSCSNCKKMFLVLLATVRAKRGRYSSKYNTRKYIIRIITCRNKEKVLEFTDSGTQTKKYYKKDDGWTEDWSRIEYGSPSNIDLRSRDVMLACYKIHNGQPHIYPNIITNCTTEISTTINKNSPRIMEEGSLDDAKEFNGKRDESENVILWKEWGDY